LPGCPYVYVKTTLAEAMSTGQWVASAVQCSICERGDKRGDAACFLQCLASLAGPSKWNAFLVGWVPDELKGVVDLWKGEGCGQALAHEARLNPCSEKLGWAADADVVVLNSQAAQVDVAMEIAAMLEVATKQVDGYFSQFDVKLTNLNALQKDRNAQDLIEMGRSALKRIYGDKNKGAFVCVVIRGSRELSPELAHRLQALAPSVAVVWAQGEADLAPVEPHLQKEVPVREALQQFLLSQRALELFMKGLGVPGPVA